MRLSLSTLQHCQFCCVSNNNCIPSFPVQPPMVSTSSLHLPVFAGSTLTIDCNIELSIEVGNEVAITAIWKRNGTMLVDTASQIVSDVIEISGTSYLSQLMFNPLRLVSDDGVYNCEARIEPQVGFVLGSVSQSNRASLHATGMSLNIIQSPYNYNMLNYYYYVNMDILGVLCILITASLISGIQLIA